MPEIAKRLSGHSVTIYGDESTRRILPEALPAKESDWGREFLGLSIACKVVENMDEAIEQPRIFCYSYNGERGPLRVEDTMDPMTVKFLEWRGHKMEVRPRGGYFGTAQGILFDVESGTMDGGADGRRLGVPVGY